MFDLRLIDRLFRIFYDGFGILLGASIDFRLISRLFRVFLSGFRGCIERRLSRSSMTIPDPAEVS